MPCFSCCTCSLCGPCGGGASSSSENQDGHVGVRPRYARLYYVFYLITIAVMTWIGRDFAAGALHVLPGLEHCDVDGTAPTVASWAGNAAGATAVAAGNAAGNAAGAATPDSIKNFVGNASAVAGNAADAVAGAVDAARDAVDSVTGKKYPPPPPPSPPPPSPPPPPPHGRSARETCVGKETVLRLSFSGWLFFAVMSLALVGVAESDSPRLPLHTAFFTVKTLLLAVIIVMPLVIPGTDFVWYGQLARIASGVFLLLQMVVLLDIVYLWNADWLEREWTYLMVAATLVLYIASLCVLGVLYHTFAPNAQCSTSIGLLTTQLVFGSIVTVLSISWQQRRQEAGVNAGLLTSGAVLFYTTILVGSALRSMPEDDGCFPKHLSDGPAWTNGIAFVFGVMAVVWTAFRTGSNAKAMGFGGGGGDVEGGAGGGWELDHRPDFFLGYFALACMYLAMLFNGWSLSGTVSRHTVEADGGWTSVWVKGVASWACWLLYAWTLAAPVIFPDRDFS